MQTTLRIDDEVYREAKAEAARRGMTLTQYIEQALENFRKVSTGASVESEAEERNRLVEALLQKTAHFRIGDRPNREEMNAR